MWVIFGSNVPIWTVIQDKLPFLENICFSDTQPEFGGK